MPWQAHPLRPVDVTRQAVWKTCAPKGMMEKNFSLWAPPLSTLGISTARVEVEPGQGGRLCVSAEPLLWRTSVVRACPWRLVTCSTGVCHHRESRMEEMCLHTHMHICIVIGVAGACIYCCVCTYMYMCIEARGQPWESFLGHHPLWFWDSVFFWHWICQVG